MAHKITILTPFIDVNNNNIVVVLLRGVVAYILLK